jgi:penicillin-binding protein 1B
MIKMEESDNNKASGVKRFFQGILAALKFTWNIFWILILIALVIGVLFGITYVFDLDEKVINKFEGKRWELPARVFSRPLEMYKGKLLNASHLEQELTQLLHYRKVSDPQETGEFRRKGNSFIIHTRGFQFADDIEPERLIKLSIRKGRISTLSMLQNNSPLTLMRLEPSLIGNFYPKHNEDRALIRLKDVSPMLLKGLLAVEDKKFYEHWGVNPMAVGRAIIANIKAGHTVQGGSTITQQLVKNYFLSNEKTWERKLKEAIMAVLLEVHYSKDEILETYLNEIYLGQDGNRSIHGVGLASQFYFNRPIKEIKIHEIAMLIGLAKGASYYNPRRNPKLALERRNLVLDQMAIGGAIDLAQAALSKQKKLEVGQIKPSGVSPFPAYLELVRKQLKRDYREEDLRNEGMLIFTSMDPILQLISEGVVRKRVRKLERSQRIRKGRLNGAMVVSTVQGGEILAVVGGRDARYAGYNRALDAKRQIGSLVKPAIFLTALENKRKFTLATRLSDAKVTVKLGRGKYWKPRNYDHRSRGAVLLFDALTLSRNTPTVRIGVKLGLNKVIAKIHALGVTSKIPEFPSILLGALELSPMEVQQMYQTIAAGGEYSPLKAIRSVMNTKGETLNRYPISVKQVASREATYLLSHTMHQITKVGTAKALSKMLPAWKKVAGKTGTTNNKRDSWFAGFSGEHVATVWVGRDDNKPTNLTGGTGALKVWGDLMRVLPTKAFSPRRPRSVHWVKIDKDSGLRLNPSCGTPLVLPFIKGSAPRKTRYCAPPPPIVTDPIELNPAALPPEPSTAPAPSTRPQSNWVDDLMQ